MIRQVHLSGSLTLFWAAPWSRAKGACLTAARAILRESLRTQRHCVIFFSFCFSFLATRHLPLLRTVLLPRLSILLYPQLPRRPQCARQYVLTCHRQPDMRHSHSPPTSRDGHKHFRQLPHERCLPLWRQHQIPVSLLHRRQGRKNPPSYAKVHRAHVRPLFRPFQTQRNPPKVLRIHSHLTPPYSLTEINKWYSGCRSSS
jgi:hypothetical protein